MLVSLTAAVLGDELLAQPKVSKQRPKQITKLLLMNLCMFILIIALVRHLDTSADRFRAVCGRAGDTACLFSFKSFSSAYREGYKEEDVNKKQLIALLVGS